MKPDTGAGPDRRGRPADPRLVALDDALVRIVNRYSRVTVRGAFYQAVVAGLLEKTEANVALVQRRLLKLRRDGRVPYHRIVDEGRATIGHRRHADLDEDVAGLYRRDYWAYADCWVQIWIEKRALIGILHDLVVDRWGLNLYVSAGQMSESQLYLAGEEIARRGVETFVYALTDFDPGGQTIFQTLRDGSKSAPGGLARFTKGVPVRVEQLALTDAQRVAWGLPTRPAKRSDGRAAKFIEKYGDVSTELDAIEPPVLLGLVDRAVARHVDPRELEAIKNTERAERDAVRRVIRGINDEFYRDPDGERN